ncbi:hypothetical protein AN8309.2 [Paecilomyces variotii No. 5]|uniref:Cytochrome P450 n=1 Tax=Byssochlamys spectabilis (strain No. 5 / NBRC 109023) TaxID=1356009 RepID=V5FBQ4_BYSSN|nr:hypothetical protein AN8309.2 [Paecilomyces variotii No. 5]
MERTEVYNIGNTLLLLSISIGSYAVLVAFYRLYLSPLSRFPGPRIAAVTWLYEFYHDAIRGGKYVWEIEKMHQRYGPVVRINPEELHVSDPDFYSVLYSQQQRRNKTVIYSKQFGTPDAAIGTVEHHVHRMRRAALNPFFSKAGVYRLESVIQQKVDLMLDRLAEFRKLGRPIPLDVMFPAFTNDVVMEYAFARSDHRLEHPDFDALFHETMLSFSVLNHWTKHMNWILTLGQSIPLWLAKRLDEGMGKIVSLQTNIANQIKDIQTGTDKNYEAVSHKTIFHDILSSNLPESEKRLDRLAQEGQVVVGAGTETTSWALTVAMFYILDNPSIRQRLETELLSLEFSDRKGSLKLSELERLPYLTACIQECLRLSYGVTSRLPRVAPDQVLKISGYDIPPGTSVAMSSVLIHRNSDVFPEPEKFRPERWLENPRLDRYLVAFSKGSRQCVGINLAYAELYMGLGGIFRSFAQRAGDEKKLVLYETSREDVEVVGDMFIPAVKKGSKGVRTVFEKIK